MDPHAEPERPDLAYRLPRDAYWLLIHTLRGSLPSPRLATGLDPVVASLLPANAGEAVLGAQFVAAHAQAMDCLRLARVPGTDTARALQCSAQAASMMRQAQSAMRLLLRGQEARQKIEADNVAVDKAAWIEHCAAGLMAQALPGAPPLVMAEPPAPEPPAAEPVQEAEPEADPVAEAEEYAVLYPCRADPPARPGARQRAVRPARGPSGPRPGHQPHPNSAGARPGGCRGARIVALECAENFDRRACARAGLQPDPGAAEGAEKASSGAIVDMHADVCAGFGSPTRQLAFSAFSAPLR
jgi:hypothetical protein